MHDVIIIGGGQSGLALGYHLAQQGRRFLLLDAANQVGHAWRSRWDSLRLLTPCPYNDLPGMPFPGEPWSFPTKDEVADYLARYVRTFDLPVRLGTRVSSVRQAGDTYEVRTADATFEARNIVCATGPFQRPHLPLGTERASSSLLQLHSSEYRNPSQVPPGKVLVVGAGNSGAGIARELAASHEVHLALGRTAASPRQLLGRDYFWWAHLLRLTDVTRDSWLGRKMRQGPDGIIGPGPEELAREHGLVLRPRLREVEGHRVTFEDGATLEVGTLVWATGFRPDYGWLEVPVLDANGAPVHQRGVTAAPGLYFLGLKWQYRADSSLLGGVGRDAAFLASHLAERLGPSQAKASPRLSQEVA
jgi:putative flavoprotein involved in K+ transport